MDRHGADRTDSRDDRQALRFVALFRALAHLRVQLPDLGVEDADLFEQFAARIANRLRKPRLRIVDRRRQPGDVRDPLRRHDAVLRRMTAERIRRPGALPDRKIMFQMFCKMLSLKFGHGKSIGFGINHPLHRKGRHHDRDHSRSKLAEFKSELGSGGDAVRDLVRSMLQEILEEEMTEALGAAKSERTSDRLGYRSGYYKRHLTTRVGQVELRVPQDRNGAFSTELFERYERSEKAFVSALMQMQVHGVSTRKVAKVTEALCGHGFSASTISRLNAKLDAELGKFAERRLEGSFPYLILNARYEKVREDGVVRDRAVLIAVGVDAAGRRQVLGVELAEGESHASWRRFLESLRDRGLCGVVQVVSDDHSGLTKAIREVVPEAVRQRCYVHFLRNARAHLNSRSGDGSLKELRWIYDRPSLEEARRDLAAWRTKVVRIFPDARSCLRLVRALCAETHESWMEDGVRYLDMDLLQEQRRADPINKTHLTLRSALRRPAAGRPKAPPNPTTRKSAVEAPDSRGRIGNRSSESLSSGLRGRSSRRGCSETEA